MLNSGDRSLLEDVIVSLLDRLLELVGLLLGWQSPGWDDPSNEEFRIRQVSARLAAVTWLRAHLDTVLIADGRAARELGLSYSEIGAMTGFSKQRAHQKFGKPATAQVSSSSGDDDSTSGR